jgi:hypothetical protein
MNIQDYIIDIRSTSLEDRLKLKQVLLDNGQKVYRYHKAFDTEQGGVSDKIRYSKTSSPSLVSSNLNMSFARQILLLVAVRVGM